MEYLELGKMIVATWTEEYKELAESNIIKMCDTQNEFIIHFGDILINLDFWNSKDKVEYRRGFAIRNTYQSQIEKIEKQINSNLYFLRQKE